MIYVLSSSLFLDQEEGELDNGCMSEENDGWKCNGTSDHSLDSRTTTLTRWVDIITGITIIYLLLIKLRKKKNYCF